jgi:O-antigen/teichoic acid export membrane protein
LGGVWAAGPTASVVRTAYILALLLPAGLIGLLLAKYLHPRPEAPADTDRSKPPTPFWRFTFGLALAAISWQVMSSFSDWYVLHAIGQAPLGQISGFRLIAQIVVILMVTVGTVLQGTIFQSWESGQRQAAIRQWTFIFKLTQLGTTLLCAVLVMGGPLAARLLPGSFREALPVWGPALFGYLLRGAMVLLSLRFTLLQRSLLVFISQAIGAGVVVWACPPLTLAWGIYGSVLAGSLACAATALAQVILLWLVKEPFDLASVLALLTSLICLLSPLGAGLAGALLVLLASHTRLFFNNTEHEALQRFWGRRKAAL